MIRLVKADQRMKAQDVTKFGNEQTGILNGVYTVYGRYNEANLFVRRPAKKPLIGN